MSLFSDEDGAVLARELDDTIRRLPGFEDAALFESARRRAEALSPSDAAELASIAGPGRCGAVPQQSLDWHRD